MRDEEVREVVMEGRKEEKGKKKGHPSRFVW